MKMMKKSELCKRYNLSNKTCNKYIDKGMPRHEIGGKIRFIEEEVADWIQQYRTTKQGRLEKMFVDEKGRTLAAYVKTNKMAELLRMTKKEIKKLMDEGLPYVTVGKKDFFHLKDVEAYFILKKEEKETAVFVVDGSYNEKTKCYGSGVVMKHQAKTKGYSFGKVFPTKHPSLFEFVAMIHALELMKKKNIPKAVIYTDQKPFVENVIGTTFNRAPWMNNEQVKPYFDQLDGLMSSLGQRVSFRYVDELPDGHQNHLYENAHVLSRIYAKALIKNVNLDQIFLPGRKITTKKKSSSTKSKTKIKSSVDEKNHSVTITYKKTEGHYCYYEVNAFGETKLAKQGAPKNPVWGAISLAKSYVAGTKNLKLNLTIQPIPNFADHMKKMLEHTDSYMANMLPIHIQYLKDHTVSFDMKDNWEAFIKTNANQSEKNNVLTVTYKKREGRFCYYAVNAFGKQKMMKYNIQNPVWGALALAKSFILRREDQKVNLTIHPIGSFEEDMNGMLNTNKLSMANKLSDIIHYLNVHTAFDMKDNWEAFIKTNPSQNETLKTA